jgi:hypothetical protein
LVNKCKKCGKSVDESKFWTVCPHNPLDQAHDAELCKTHNQYDCFACEQYLVRR